MLGMRSSTTPADALDKLVAALQAGQRDEATARQLYELGPHAVTLALLSAASRIAELQARATGGVSPSTPSGQRPVYTKPDAAKPGGRRHKRPGGRKGHPCAYGKLHPRSSPQTTACWGIGEEELSTPAAQPEAGKQT